ncbi:hypothetical protein BJ875DRAFT_440902 [Amylocarpus encephaloides]|uniref:Uncharacterized protein n=1 Tax=Amylocarpus encephaloides TaxID=45428 RepID=A0A9P7YJW3_9HELO|nr:hypothetical protein BJ875DRAFT_440902 [Amylocarpus encephaloides]
MPLYDGQEHMLSPRGYGAQSFCVVTTDGFLILSLSLQGVNPRVIDRCRVVPTIALRYFHQGTTTQGVGDLHAGVRAAEIAGIDALVGVELPRETNPLASCGEADSPQMYRSMQGEGREAIGVDVLYVSHALPGIRSASPHRNLKSPPPPSTRIRPRHAIESDALVNRRGIQVPFRRRPRPRGLEQTPWCDRSVLYTFHGNLNAGSVLVRYAYLRKQLPCPFSVDLQILPMSEPRSSVQDV